jgi:threonine/homoserine/homoserine lactone efflux protein
MTPLALYLTFVFASTVVLLIPGPNIALIACTRIADGPRAGPLTIAGTSCAIGLQLPIAVVGMTALLTISANWFSALRWIGILSLLYLGACAWRPLDLIARPPVKPAIFAVFWRGVLISLANPKTLLFFGAFLSQFVSPSSPLPPQPLVLSVSFLALVAVLDVLLAGRQRCVSWLNGRVRNRLQGGLLIGAAALLALARKR